MSIFTWIEKKKRKKIFKHAADSFFTVTFTNFPLNTKPSQESVSINPTGLTHVSSWCSLVERRGVKLE